MSDFNYLDKQHFRDLGFSRGDARRAARESYQNYVQEQRKAEGLTSVFNQPQNSFMNPYMNPYMMPQQPVNPMQAMMEMLQTMMPMMMMMKMMGIEGGDNMFSSFFGGKNEGTKTAKADKQGWTLQEQTEADKKAGITNETNKDGSTRKITKTATDITTEIINKEQTRTEITKTDLDGNLISRTLTGAGCCEVAGKKFGKIEFSANAPDSQFAKTINISGSTGGNPTTYTHSAKTKAKLGNKTETYENVYVAPDKKVYTIDGETLTFVGTQV